jgi:hypothetical protein
MKRSSLPTTLTLPSLTRRAPPSPAVRERGFEETLGALPLPHFEAGEGRGEGLARRGAA